MAKEIYMDFKKGDTRTHRFKLPLSEYVVGGKLYFAAKAAVDNDATDAVAVIDKSFTDANVTLDATHATWECTFDAADLAGVNFANGDDVNEYEGEFQYVDGSGKVSSFPDDNNFLKVRVYADVKRGVA